MLLGIPCAPCPLTVGFPSRGWVVGKQMGGPVARGRPWPGGLVVEERLVSIAGGHGPGGSWLPPITGQGSPLHQATSHPGCQSAAPETCVQRVQATGSEAFGTLGQNGWLTTQSINTAVSSQSKRKLGGGHILGSNNSVHTPSGATHPSLWWDHSPSQGPVSHVAKPAPTRSGDRTWPGGCSRWLPALSPCSWGTSGRAPAGCSRRVGG